MNKLTVFAATAALLFSSCADNTMNNPILADSGLPHGAPAFDKIKSEDFRPAFEYAIAKAKEEIDAIINSNEEPDFRNTIEAMEYAGSDLNKVSGLFFNLKEANSDETMRAIAEEVSPKLTEFSLYISMNEKLFERVKSVYDRKESLGLDEEQMKLLENTYKSFARNGANLPEEKKAEFGEIMEKVSVASLKFGNNSLAATNAFTLEIKDSNDLAGLPKFVINMAAGEAKSRGKDGWIFTLQYPSFGPFMKYSANRELRKEMWTANATQCTSGEFDNSEIIKEIVNYRLQAANLLGYETHADYVLEENMAKTRDNVTDFLNRLVKETRPFAENEVKELKKYARENGLEGKLMPWDISYYSEKLKHEKYSLNDEMLKPYFKLENVQNAVFGLANRLYGITITENGDYPVYHPDVKAFEVNDRDGKFLALLYVDYFPRASKSSGAWMTEFRGQRIKDGKEERPVINLVLNFTKPTETEPSLLTFYEVTTFLHEFGHGLHGIFSKGTYGSLTGTNVARDFVELPSQIMENWATEPEFLASFAKHYETGEVIPQEYIDKIIESKNFQSGYAQMRQLSLGLIDMAWHTLSEPFSGNVLEFEKKASEPTKLMVSIEGTGTSPVFGHIFAGGYDAGYYSYKWAEVLEADAFSLFKEKGIFNTEVAQSFRENILSRGGIEDADVLYRNFRGRDPEPEALMHKLGLVK